MGGDQSQPHPRYKPQMTVTDLMETKNPLFIIGNPRSGTTLLRLILTSHSEVLIPPECGFIIWLKEKYINWQKLDNNDRNKRMSFIEDLISSRKFDTWQLDVKIIEQKINAVQPVNYAELCGVVYGAFGLSIGKKYSVWGDKNNFHINHMDELLGLYSGARFLHIVRDGRDVACSYREVMAKKSNSPYAPKLNTDISDIAKEWFENVMKVDSFMNKLPRNQAMTVRYEDLVKHSSETVRSMCDWLGLSFEGEMLNFYQQNKDKTLEPELTMDWKIRTVQPISDETIGRYKSLFSDEELIQFDAEAKVALDKFCYL